MKSLEQLKSEALTHWVNELHCVNWDVVMNDSDPLSFSYYQDQLLKMLSYLESVAQVSPGKSSV